MEMTRKHLQELAGMDEETANAKAKAGDSTETKAAPPVDFLSVYLQSLREELLLIERRQSDLQALAEKEDAQARSLMQEEIEDTNRKSEMDRLSKLFSEFTVQISEIQVNSGMGGVTAQVLSPAKHGYLVYPIISKFLGLGGFLGAFVGLVLGYLVEVADRSFRKPEDIIREFGVPIVGHVPFITEQRLKSIPGDSRMDRTAVSVHLPRSRPAEAYRAVRTAMCFNSFGGTHRVISVTSPAAGDGKSTLALNLALSLAQSGKKTVLMESDFRRPKVHKLTGVENKIGVVEVLRGEAELVDAIKSTDVADFSVLPCGKRPKDPAELLARPEFEQLLQVLRERFDYVIIDTPPVLAVTDPCGVAARVDGVLVCMRLSRHTRDLGRRTIEQLRDVGATISGLVVNGVEERDAYGYGNYRYSDYRYYYKNYNYKYGEYGSKDGREYYADDHASELTTAGSDSSNDGQ
jgi:capsular exopolysaccharide synthesis family protein